jgi:hypothetical protein
MKYLFPILLIVLANPDNGFAQASSGEIVELRGIIFDKDNNQPLAYVSIGIKDKPIGTISDSGGHYSLQAYNENLADTVLVSLIGYESKMILLGALLNGKSQDIFLSRKDYILPGVVISNQFRNTVVVGRQSSSKLIQISLHHKESFAETIGSEMGIRVKLENKESLLKNVHCYFSANNFSYIKFRVNIYSIKNNMPDTLLADKQIFVEVKDFKTGWNIFDLDSYNIRLKQDFIITLQWIECRMEKPERPITIVPVSLSNAKTTYTRIASQDRWKRMGLSPSMYISLLQ